MGLTLTVPDRAELQSLYDWLRHDQQIAGSVTVDLSSSGRAAGEQGALDVIDMVLTQATAMASLAVSIAGWRLARRRDATVTFRRGESERVADAADPAAMEKAILELSGKPDEPDGEGSTGTGRKE